jgi:hypothetical protein
MRLNKNNIRKVLLLGLMSAFAVMSAYAQEIQVYTTSIIPVKDREKALKEDAGLSGVNVTVFGQFREFSSSIESSKPKFLIVPAAFLKYNKDYKAVYQFAKGGQTNFKFLILATKPEWTLAKGKDGNIGIVDELGRKETDSFIKDEIGDFKRSKRVTKPDDLMPLLVLENAEYIAIRPENYETLKEKFTAKTIQVGESKTVDYPVICALASATDEEIAKVGSMSAQTIKALGFDELKKVK